jgi:hypothetical protein
MAIQVLVRYRDFSLGISFPCTLGYIAACHETVQHEMLKQLGKKLVPHHPFKWQVHLASFVVVLCGDTRECGTSADLAIAVYESTEPSKCKRAHCFFTSSATHMHL